MRPQSARRCAAVCCALCLLALSACGSEAQRPADAASPFDMPRLQAEQGPRIQQAAAAAARQDFAAAEQLLVQVAAALPDEPQLPLELAALAMRQGKTDQAFVYLQQAIDRGYRNGEQLANHPQFQALQSDDRFLPLLKAANGPPLDKPARPAAVPLVPRDGQVVVGEKNVTWNPRLNVLEAAVEFPDEAKPKLPIAVSFGEVGDLLRRWDAAGTAAGNWGDLYDNHDSDHSLMNVRAFPQITSVEFSPEAKQRQLHHGLQRYFLYNAPTIGNSSTAVAAGPVWRGQGRLALTMPGGGPLLHLQYRANQLYFYPEHRDHDAGRNGQDGGGFGDVTPANTPYYILSQGSSGSDGPFMNAVAATLAAFRPDVKQKLVRHGLLMPTVQMIFRRSNKQVTGSEVYLSGAAHPTVFRSAELDAKKMATMAQSLQADTLPPLVQLRVVEEDEPRLGVDYFDVGPREKLLDTPQAIARVVKGLPQVRRLVVSAEQSLDVDGRPLTYHWSVLRGDAERIQINRLNESGSIVELLVPYHERRPIAPGSDMESNRVDIGAFVHNGAYYSAPAFVSLFYLDNERREYDEQGRIRVVDYTHPDYAGNYVDPLLDLKKDWRDEFDYAADGLLTGWTRIRGAERQRFTADGQLVLETSDDGAPTKTAAVGYTAEMTAPGVGALKQVVLP